MPHANIWIRKEDVDKWQALEKKSEFIHNALNDGGVSGMVGALVKAEYVEEAEFTEKDGKPVYTGKTCKHGYNPNYCKFAKQGKPCKG